jgi:phosphoglycolate phosphatase-like HAD superfamily hydrolase
MPQTVTAFPATSRARFDLDLAASWMIGDREIDILCGGAAGVPTIHVAGDHPVSEPSRPAADRTARERTPQPC